MGCFICTIFTAITTLCALIFVTLDLISWGVPEFVIDKMFPTIWRSRFWKGFILCDIIMLFANLILLIMSIILIVAIVWPTRYRLYHLKPYLRAWCTIMIMHLITDLGVGLYTYSWYGLAAWRAPYLIFSVMYFIVCYVLHLWCLVVCCAYKAEVIAELQPNTEEEAVYTYAPVYTRDSAY
ncbi:unnamed protein product [Dicrocoelium dendriticum]|nr:unnamed protein product [Dicrocoelium dendriticum]